MKIITCPDCGLIQGTLMEKNYVLRFKTGVCCDERRQFEGEMTANHLEERLEIIRKNYPIYLIPR